MAGGSTSRPGIGILVLAMCGIATSLQFTLVLPILPELPQILGHSGETTSWIVTSTLLASAVSTPILSRMADMYGKRRILVLALAVMSLGSVLCAVTSWLPMILLGRSMQGFAASLIAVGISLLRDQLPPERIASAIALMSATVGVGAAMGLPLSGLLTDWFGWHSIFWFSAIVGVLLAAGLVMVVPESRLRTPGRFDVPGAILLSIALVALLLPLTKGSMWGWTSPQVIGCAALGIVTLALWIPLELRANHPMVDLRTAAYRPVLLTNIASVFAGFAMFVNVLVTSHLLQQPASTGFGLGLTPAETGLAMLIPGLMMVVLAPFSGRLLHAWGARNTLLIGCAILTVTQLLRSVFSGSLVEIVAGSTLASIGAAVAFAAMPALIMASVPITQTASANGLNSLVRSIGQALGSASVALLLGVLIQDVDGISRPTEMAIQAIFWVTAVVVGAGCVAMWFVPRRQPEGATRRYSDDQPETVITGRVTLPASAAGEPVTPSVVSVLDLAGRQLDWRRSSPDGSYSVVVPGPGSYALVVHPLGWASVGTVVDVTGDDTDHDLAVTERLTITGLVTAGGTTCPQATVSLTAINGVHLATAVCDAEGRYTFTLPRVGRYVVTAIDAATRSAHARKVLLAYESQQVDLDCTPSR